MARRRRLHCAYQKSHPGVWVLIIGESCNDLSAMLAVLKSISWELFRRLLGPTPEAVDVVSLRHKVMVLQRQLGQRPTLTRWDRLLFATLYHTRPEVLQSISIVRPETLVRWHRAGFRLFWKHKARGHAGRPCVPTVLSV